MRNFTQILRVVLGKVGPHVDHESSAAGPIQSLPPVPETGIRSVAGGVEPPLVTAEHFAVQRRAINICTREPRVGMQPRLVRIRARCLGRALRPIGRPMEVGARASITSPQSTSRLSDFLEYQRLCAPLAAARLKGVDPRAVCARK